MITMNQDIVLVETNADDIELMRHEFDAHEFNHRIVVLRDGAEAVNFLIGQPDAPATADLPRAILLSWKLTKLDGLAVLRRLKSNERTSRVPTFLLISSLQDVAHLKVEQVQPDGYLIKPVSFHEFVRQFGSAAARQFNGNQMTLVSTAQTKTTAPKNSRHL